MRNATLSFLFALASSFAFGQPDAFIEVLQQTNCDSTTHVGQIHFFGLSQPGVDSVKIGLFRSGYAYQTFVRSNSFDTTMDVPPGWYQISKRLYPDTNYYWSDEVSVHTCTGFGSQIDPGTDTDCTDDLGLLHFAIYSDDWLDMIAEVWKDGALYTTFETNEAVDSLMQVPAGSYDIRVKKYHHQDFVESWAYTAHVIPCFSTSVSEVTPQTDEFDFSTYPNPAVNDFTIKSDKATTYEVYNLAGEKILSGQIVSGKSLVDVSTWSDGVYLVKVFAADRAITKRFIVAK